MRLSCRQRAAPGGDRTNNNLRQATVIDPPRQSGTTLFGTRAKQRTGRPVSRWLHHCLRLCTLVLCLCLAGFSEPPDRQEVLFRAESFPDGWMYYCAEKSAKIEDVWQAVKGTDGKADVLICRGKPYGYVRTEKEYGNFELGLEWMYPTDPNGNSGVLIFTNGKDKIWPDAVQIQLHAPTAGSIFPSGKATSENKLMVRDLSKPPGQWNTCIVTARDGRVSVQINGMPVGEVTGCNPRKGGIALQSEGAEVHFRRLWLRRLQSR